MKKEKWISVNKKLPKEGEEVLVFAPNCHIIGKKLIGVCFHEDDGVKWTVYDFTESKLSELVTHWQPLPKEPF